MLLTSIFMIVLSVSTFSIANGQLPGHLPLKKINRSVEKEWGRQVFNSISLQEDPGGCYYLLSSEGSEFGYLYAGKVNTCRPGGCAVPGTIAENEGEGFENFRYYMLVDTQFNVMEVRIFEYNATHGQEVGAKSWLRQFIGMDPEDDPSYGNEINAISGATISGLSITADINRVLDQLMEMRMGVSVNRANKGP